MMKSQTSKLHVKQKSYSYQMVETGLLEYHIAVFNEIIANLDNLEVKCDEEDLSLILLCSFSLNLHHLETRSFIVVKFSPLKIRMLLF